MQSRPDSHAPRSTSAFQGQSAINQDAADGGYWHQRALIGSLNSWRRDPLGARLALALFGEHAARAGQAGADPMDDPSAKPDLRAWMRGADGLRHRHVSAKLARIGSTDSPSRPMHHAARVKFDDASEHGLLPDSDFELRGALIAHFVDGEALSQQDPEISGRALAWLRTSWPRIARSAIEGLGELRADAVVISLAREAADGSMALEGTRMLDAQDAIALLTSEPPTMSEPRDGQVGTIGSRLMHIQRGQALSLGAQRDIQIKINAGALFLAASELPALGGA